MVLAMTIMSFALKEGLGSGGEQGTQVVLVHMEMSLMPSHRVGAAQAPRPMKERPRNQMRSSDVEGVMWILACTV